MCFFAALSDFGLILGGPGPSKKLLKIKKIVFGAHGVSHGRFGGVGAFWDGFGRVLGTISERFGKILDGFLGASVNFLLRCFIEFLELLARIRE